MVLITENLGRDAISASSDSMKGAPKYYVVVHGKPSNHIPIEL